MLSDGNQIYYTFEPNGDKHTAIMTSLKDYTNKHQKHYGNLIRSPSNQIVSNQRPNNQTSNEHVITFQKTQKTNKTLFCTGGERHDLSAPEYHKLISGCERLNYNIKRQTTQNRNFRLLYSGDVLDCWLSNPVKKTQNILQRIPMLTVT